LEIPSEAAISFWKRLEEGQRNEGGTIMRKSTEPTEKTGREKNLWTRRVRRGRRKMGLADDLKTGRGRRASLSGQQKGGKIRGQG